MSFRKIAPVKRTRPRPGVPGRPGRGRVIVVGRGCGRGRVIIIRRRRQI